MRLSPLLSVVALSIISVRVSAKALVLTGLSEEVARFQARSIFTGTGYSTEEAESVMQHPLRRRIAMMMMLAQNAGLVTVVSMFVLSFVDAGGLAVTLQRGLILVGGLATLAVLARSKWVERAIEWGLDRFTDLAVKDYYHMLNLEEDFTISRHRMSEGSWLADKTLEGMDLPGEGVMVLSILRTGEAAPGGTYRVYPGDELTLYGEASGLEELSGRLGDASGDEAHETAKERHRRRTEENDRRNEAYEQQGSTSRDRRPPRLWRRGAPLQGNA